MTDDEKLKWYESELASAIEMQRQLVPRDPPAVAGFEVHGQCHQFAGVGGDYYDYLFHGGGKLGLVVADVAGKGISASFMAAHLRSILRSRMLSDCTDLSGLFFSMNRLVFEASPSNRFIALFYAEYEPSLRVLRYVNAGHTFPMLVRQNGRECEVIELDIGGVAVGMFADPPGGYKTGQLRLVSGDFLVVFTDGVTDAADPTGEAWGKERLKEKVSKLPPTLRACEVVSDILGTVVAFSEVEGLNDDTTVVVLKID